MIYTSKLRFSALASCVTLAPASMQLSQRGFRSMDGVYAHNAGAIAGPYSHEKITIFRNTLNFTSSWAWPFLRMSSVLQRLFDSGRDQELGQGTLNDSLRWRE